jgi:hypothetical protein
MSSAALVCAVQAVRVFVESVLRYGLPVNFVCALVKPSRGSDKRLHELLTVRLGCAVRGLVSPSD